MLASVKSKYLDKNNSSRLLINFHYALIEKLFDNSSSIKPKLYTTIKMTVPASDGYRGTKRRTEEDEEGGDMFNPMVCYFQGRSTTNQFTNPMSENKVYLTICLKY